MFGLQDPRLFLDHPVQLPGAVLPNASVFARCFRGPPFRPEISLAAGMSRAAIIRQDRLESTIHLKDTEKFFFELNDFAILKGVLTREEVDRCNAAIDAHADESFHTERALEGNSKVLGGTLD